jgi:hypothetical protein
MEDNFPNLPDLYEAWAQQENRWRGLPQYIGTPTPEQPALDEPQRIRDAEINRLREMNRNDGDGLTVWVWWEASCGYTHYETNPVTVEVVCPHHDEEGES